LPINYPKQNTLKKTPEKYSKSLHIENAVHKTLSHDNDDKTYKRLSREGDQCGGENSAGKYVCVDGEDKDPGR
jgi:hypothetical protein